MKQITVGRGQRAYAVRVSYVNRMPSNVFDEVVVDLKKKFSGVELPQIVHQTKVVTKTLKGKIIEMKKKPEKRVKLDKRAFRHFVKQCVANDVEPDITKLLSDTKLTAEEVRWALQVVYDETGRGYKEEVGHGQSEVQYTTVNLGSVLRVSKVEK